MKRKLGIVLVVIGALLLSGALGLYMYNDSVQRKAGESTDNLMPQLIEVIQNRHSEDNAAQPVQEAPAVTLPEIYKSQMPVAEIDGNSYIGFVSIPKLELELPVMADWSYSKLQISPCRFSGDMYTDDLVVMAHNYERHFGSLKDLREGDTVTFTDMDGASMSYSVAAIDVLERTDVEEMIAGEYDLTLFTCTYGGKSRITVRCDRMAE